MSNSDDFDPIATLTENALHLNSISRPGWFARPFYDLLADSIVWTDETNRRTPIDVISALRLVTAYRTGLMLGKPDPDHKPFWDLGLQLFPNWVGFRPDRRQMTDRIRRIYRRGQIETDKCIRDLERYVNDSTDDDT